MRVKNRYHAQSGQCFQVYLSLTRNSTTSTNRRESVRLSSQPRLRTHPRKAASGLRRCGRPTPQQVRKARSEGRSHVTKAFHFCSREREPFQRICPERMFAPNTAQAMLQHETSCLCRPKAPLGMAMPNAMMLQTSRAAVNLTHDYSPMIYACTLVEAKGRSRGPGTLQSSIAVQTGKI